MCTTGVPVVEEESDSEVEELPSLEVLVGSLFLDDVVFEGVSEVVSAEVVDFEEEEEVVGSAEVVVGSSEEDEEEEEEEEEEEDEELVVVGSAAVEAGSDELESLVIEPTRSVTAAD